MSSYNSLQDSQKKITDSVTECGNASPFDQEISEEMAAKYPMLKHMDPYMRQGMQFSKCFMPEFSRVCGLKSQ